MISFFTSKVFLIHHKSIFFFTSKVCPFSPKKKYFFFSPQKYFLFSPQKYFIFHLNSIFSFTSTVFSFQPQQYFIFNSKVCYTTSPVYMEYGKTFFQLIDIYIHFIRNKMPDFPIMQHTVFVRYK